MQWTLNVSQDSNGLVSRDKKVYEIILIAKNCVICDFLWFFCDFVICLFFSDFFIFFMIFLWFCDFSLILSFPAIFSVILWYFWDFFLFLEWVCTRKNQLFETDLDILKAFFIPHSKYKPQKQTKTIA